MEIKRISLHLLTEMPTGFDVVVAIDVLRSFSTAAYALAAHAAAVYPVETVPEALRLRDEMPDAVLVGALPGGQPIPEFVLGNSPSALVSRGAPQLAGRPVILSTASGVRALVRFRQAPALFATGLVCAGATARAVLARKPRRVLLVTTGEWSDRDGDEDVACADYLITALQGRVPDGAALEQRVRQSDFGRRFAAATHPALPPADLALCAQVDRFEFALPVTQEGSQLVLRPMLP